jgi:hypothetical protein
VLLDLGLSPDQARGLIEVSYLNQTPFISFEE